MCVARISHHMVAFAVLGFGGWGLGAGVGLVRA